MHLLADRKPNYGCGLHQVACSSAGGASNSYFATLQSAQSCSIGFSTTSLDAQENSKIYETAGCRHSSHRCQHSTRMRSVGSSVTIDISCRIIDGPHDEPTSLLKAIQVFWDITGRRIQRLPIGPPRICRLQNTRPAYDIDALGRPSLTVLAHRSHGPVW